MIPILHLRFVSLGKVGEPLKVPGFTLDQLRQVPPTPLLAQGDWLNVCLTLWPHPKDCAEREGLPLKGTGVGLQKEGGGYWAAKEPSADNENIVSYLSGTSLVQGSANFRKGW